MRVLMDREWLFEALFAVCPLSTIWTGHPKRQRNGIPIPGSRLYEGDNVSNVLLLCVHASSFPSLAETFLVQKNRPGLDVMERLSVRFCDKASGINLNGDYANIVISLANTGGIWEGKSSHVPCQSARHRDQRQNQEGGPESGRLKMCLR
jgi:hypothetical protein